LKKLISQKIDKILELNPDHEIYKIIKVKYSLNSNNEEIKEIANLLYDQAMLAQGFLPENPAEI